MATPRLRQLRRDNTVFALVMNAIRLQLEEDDCLDRQPHLGEHPDAELLQIQQATEQWLGLATGYVMQKHRCPFELAMRLVDELQAELEQDVPPEEVRQVPLSVVLNLPPGLPAS